MKDAQIQLMKIHNFHFPSPKKMKFDIFLYFFGKQIAKFIVLRARITYFNRLRNLQEMSDESVRVDCRISQDYSYLLEDELYGIQGEIINFNCKSNSTADSRLANITINTDVSMTLISLNYVESLDFGEVNFNGNSSEESNNIQNNRNRMKKMGKLENTEILVENNYLIFIGEINPSNTFDNVKKIKMFFMNQEGIDNYINNYYCNVTTISKPLYEINCAISDSFINTTVNNLHLSTGITENGEETEDGVFLTIDLKNGLNNKTEIVINPLPVMVKQTVINYRKSSDGLSGGAIAGIVIGGVAVIVAISIISIILIKRNRKPNEDNQKTDLNNTEQDKMDQKIYDPKKIDPKTYDPKKIDPKTYDPKKIDPKTEPEKISPD